MIIKTYRDLVKFEYLSKEHSSLKESDLGALFLSLTVMSLLISVTLEILKTF